MWKTIKTIKKLFLKKIKSGSVNILTITGSNRWDNPSIVTGFCSFKSETGQTFIDKITNKRDKFNYDIKLLTAVSKQQPPRSIAQPILNANILCQGCTKIIINTSFKMRATESVTKLTFDVYRDGIFFKTINLNDVGYTDPSGGSQSLTMIFKFRFSVSTPSLNQHIFTFKNIKQTNYNVSISEFYVNSVEEFKPDYNNEITSDIILYVYE